MNRQRIKNSLIAFAGLSALIVIIAAATSGTTQGQAGTTSSKEVVVVNTPSVNVANAVRATQEGAWSVSLNGKPTVDLAGGASVGIDPTRNIVRVESAREPVTIPLSALIITNPDVETYSYEIPEGKRLVVEHVYGATSNSPDKAPLFFLESVRRPGSPILVHSLTLSYSIITLKSASGTVGNRNLLTQPVKFYVPNPADDGEAWGVRLRVNDLSLNDGPLTLTGYLEPLP